ncbi:MAG: hypothetical protein AAY43_05695 [Methanosarcina sp. 795]|nr:MAG: hypothetical protein AAY43_05695 [Methanosarcina sp. 795]
MSAGKWKAATIVSFLHVEGGIVASEYILKYLVISIFHSIFFHSEICKLLHSFDIIQAWDFTCFFLYFSLLFYLYTIVEF